MNYNNIWILIFFFVMHCSDNNNIIEITNPPSNLPSINYSLNLTSDSGKFLDSVRIFWNNKEGNVIINENDINSKKDENGTNYYTFQMNSSTDSLINFKLISTDAIYEDTIHIFTKSMYSITNLNYEYQIVKKGNNIWDSNELLYDYGTDGIKSIDINGDGIYNPEEGDISPDADNTENNNQWDIGEYFDDKLNNHYHRKISWTPINEDHSNTIEYIIYRINKDLIASLLNRGNNNIYSHFTPIKTLLQADSSYIDSSEENTIGHEEFAYFIKSKSNNHEKNSFIINYQTSNQLSIELQENQISTTDTNYIKINWEPINDTEKIYFYQYEIWRSLSDNNFTNNLIVELNNVTTNSFLDRTCGRGRSCYYSLAVVDIVGNRIYSNYFRGWTNP